MHALPDEQLIERAWDADPGTLILKEKKRSSFSV
jgi:hypothetical protein